MRLKILLRLNSTSCLVEKGGGRIESNPTKVTCTMTRSDGTDKGVMLAWDIHDFGRVPAIL